MIKQAPRPCIAVIVWCACAASPRADDPAIDGSHAHDSNAAQDTTSRPDNKAGDLTPSPTLASELAAIVAGRQHGFDLLANRLPDKTTLAIELLRTTDDAAAAIFTVAQGGKARRYVVMTDGSGRMQENARPTSLASAIASVDDDIIDPATLAIAEALPGDADNLGLATMGERLLANVVGSLDHPEAGDTALGSASSALRAELADRAPASGELAMTCAPRGRFVKQSKALTDVSAARWRGFQRLARSQAVHQVLAVELFRTLNDNTVAVFTLSKNRQPARYVVTGDASGKLRSEACSRQTDAMEVAADLPNAPPGADDRAADPGAVSLGRPPPQQPVTPGVVVAGSLLLGAAFDVGEFADTPAE